eukprot:2766917-Amphidinium_carterae.1
MLGLGLSWVKVKAWPWFSWDKLQWDKDQIGKGIRLNNGDEIAEHIALQIAGIHTPHHAAKEVVGKVRA